MESQLRIYILRYGPANLCRLKTKNLNFFCIKLTKGIMFFML